MRVVWSRQARSNLAEIVRFIKRDDERAARRVFDRIWNAVGDLTSMEDRGRIDSEADTRELLFPPWPYIVGYRIVKGEVRILYVRHASRKWPQHDRK